MSAMGRAPMSAMASTIGATGGTVGIGLARAQGTGTGPDTRERHTPGQCIEPTFAIVSHCFEAPKQDKGGLRVSLSMACRLSQSEVA